MHQSTSSVRSQPGASRQAMPKHLSLVAPVPRYRVTAFAAATVNGPPVTAFRINLASDTLVSLPISKTKAATLKQALTTLTETLAAKAKATRPQRWPMMEWKLQQDETGEEIEHMEVLCNPNAHASIFEAKALISVCTRGGLKLSSEARIPSLQADLDAFLSAAQ